MPHSQSKALSERFYHYRGMAIQSLSESIGVERHNTEDVVLAGVLTLLLVDASAPHAHHITHAQLKRHGHH